MNDLQPDRVRSAAVTLDKLRETVDDPTDQKMIDRAIEICDEQLGEVDDA